MEIAELKRNKFSLIILVIFTCLCLTGCNDKIKSRTTNNKLIENENKLVTPKTIPENIILPQQAKEDNNNVLNNGLEEKIEAAQEKILQDTTPPTGNIKINDGAATTESKYVTLNLEAYDAESGVISMTFTNGGKWSPWEPFKNLKEDWDIKDVRYGGGSAINNWRYVYVMFADKADNISKVYSAKIQYIAKDYDNDGLSDKDEEKYKTDPKNCDTDRDGYFDEEEIKNNYDPLRPAKSLDINTSDWYDYTNEYYGFKLKYPKDWYKEGKGKNEILITSSAGNILPQPKDSLRIEIKISENKDNISAKDFARKGYHNLDYSPLREFTVNEIPIFQLCSQRWLSGWGGYTTYITNKGIALKIESYFNFTNNDTRSSFINILNKIIDSIDLREIHYTDITPPVGNIIINKGYDMTISKFVTLNLSAYDDQSEKIYMCFSNGGGWSEWEPYNKIKYNWDMSYGLLSGIIKNSVSIHVKFRDSENNIAGEYGQIYDSIVYKKDYTITQPITILGEDENKLKDELKVELSNLGISFSKLSQKDQETLFNAYIYGGYPLEAIVQAVKFSGYTVHPTIHWLTWKETKDYKNYINKE